MGSLIMLANDLRSDLLQRVEWLTSLLDFIVLTMARSIRARQASAPESLPALSKTLCTSCLHCGSCLYCRLSESSGHCCSINLPRRDNIRLSHSLWLWLWLCLCRSSSSTSSARGWTQSRRDVTDASWSTAALRRLSIRELASHIESSTSHWTSTGSACLSTKAIKHPIYIFRSHLANSKSLSLQFINQIYSTLDDIVLVASGQDLVLINAIKCMSFAVHLLIFSNILVSFQ